MRPEKSFPKNNRFMKNQLSSVRKKVKKLKWFQRLTPIANSIKLSDGGE
jgi:hypothetical protein